MATFGRLVLTASGGHEQEYVLEKSQIILGRGTTSDIIIPDARVSRTHARLECSASGCTLFDLGSANGISLNRKPVEQVRLAPGDVIELGDSTLRYEVETAEIAQEIAPIDTEADLDATLARATVPMMLTNTSIPRLAVHSSNKTWEVLLEKESISIGRHDDNDLVLEQASVSRHHARVERVGDDFLIRDLDSTNGTRLGNQRVAKERLGDGDTIRIGDTRLVFKRGFGANDLTVVDEHRPPTDLVSTSSHPPVVFVPGMMGSMLWRGDEQLWPNVKVMFTQPEVFRFSPDDAVEARGIVDEVVIVPNLIKQQHYGRLGDYLEEALSYERGHDLFEFAYDWRQDNRLSAQRLASAIEEWQITQPITLIAHSLGCIVSRYYIERLGGKRKVGRLILLGGPHAGYPKAMSHLLLGPDILPFGFLGEKVRQVIATFPALYQILPTSACVVDQTGNRIDILSDDSWLPAEHRPLLHDAQLFRRELGLQTSVPTVSIFGYGLKTITGIKVQRTLAGQWKHVDFDHEAVGDTDVPTSSAVLDGSEIHPVQQHHGSLYVDNDVKMRLKLELTR